MFCQNLLGRILKLTFQKVLGTCRNRALIYFCLKHYQSGFCSRTLNVAVSENIGDELAVCRRGGGRLGVGKSELTTNDFGLIKQNDTILFLAQYIQI